MGDLGGAERDGHGGASSASDRRDADAVTTRARGRTSLAGAHAVQVPPQAKINLRLRILARETSGYHQLETLFLRLELADTVRVRRAAGALARRERGRRTTDALGPVEKNLAWRAAVAYADAAGCAERLRDRAREAHSGRRRARRRQRGRRRGAARARRAWPRTRSASARCSPSRARLAPTFPSSPAERRARSPGDAASGCSPSIRHRRATWCCSCPRFAVDTAEAYGWLAAPRARHAADTGLRPERRGRCPAGRGSRAARDERLRACRRCPASRDRRARRRAARGGRRSPAMMSGSGSAVFGVAAASGPRAPRRSTVRRCACTVRRAPVQRRELSRSRRSRTSVTGLRARLLPLRPMAGQRPLEPRMVVRIHEGQ